MDSPFTVKVDATNLNLALKGVLDGYTRRTPAVAVNSAALVVSRFAWRNTPFADTNTIEADLEVQTTPVILKSGRVSKNKRRQHENVEFDSAKTAADMIVVSRLWSASKYSVSTGNYWALDMPRGYGRAYGGENVKAKFWEWVRIQAERMVKARRASSKFLQSCWIPAIRALEPFASRSIAGGRGLGPGRNEKFVEDSGWANPARPGATVAVCEIANAAGTSGINSVLDTKHNDAEWRAGAPVLQRAIDDEARNLTTFKQVADEELKKDARALAGLGLIVT